MFEANALVNNRYQIVKEIARGGMGVIYLAEDTQLSDIVALKVSLWHDENLRKAFEREAQVLAKLKHTNLPTVRGHFFEDRFQCLVMEFIEGENLREKILNSQSGRGLPFDVCLKIGKQLCQVVEYLHAKGVLHRDIKPENIKQTADGAIVLLDFGLAKSSETSVLGSSMGYAAVEQISNAGTTERSDIYSIGATLYHLLSGELPIPSVHRLSEVSDGNSDPLLSLEKLGKTDRRFSNMIAKAMALKAENRFSTVTEFRLELENDSDSQNQIEIPTPQIEVAKPMVKELLSENELKFDQNITKPSDVLEVLKTEPSVLPKPEPVNDFKLIEEVESNNNTAPRSAFNYFYLAPISIFIIAMIGFAALSIWLVYPTDVPELKNNSIAKTNKPTENTNNQSQVLPDNQLNLSVGIYWLRGKNQATLVAPEHIFRTGDKLRFNFTTAQNGFLHIVTINPDGNAVLLFPPVQMPENEKLEFSKISKDKENFFPNQDGFEYGETQNTAEAYTVDKIFFVFAEDYNVDLLSEIRETMGKTNSIKSKKYSSQDYGISINDEKVKLLLEKLSNIAQKVDEKTKEIKFNSTQKVVVGYLETRSGGR